MARKHVAWTLALLLAASLVAVSAAATPDRAADGLSWFLFEPEQAGQAREAAAHYKKGRFSPLPGDGFVMLEPGRELWLRVTPGQGSGFVSLESRATCEAALFPMDPASGEPGNTALSVVQGDNLVLPLGLSGAYVRVTSPEPTHVDAGLHPTMNSAVDSFLRRAALSGAFLAGILVFAAINLLFGYSLKQSNLFWYAGLLAAFGLDVLINSGMLGNFMPVPHWLGQRLSIPLQAGFLALAGGFARSFLMTKRYAPRADALLAGYSLGVMVLGVVVALAAGPKARVLLLPFLVALPVLTTVVGALCYRAGFTPAKFFILGWLCFFGGPLAVLLGHAGFMRLEIWPPGLLMAGTFLQMFVFMLAVLDRVQVLREQRLQLEKAAVRVNSALATQRRLFRDISHELRSPLARLWLALEMIRSKAGPNTEADVAQATRDIIRMRELQDQMTTLAKLQSGEPWRMENVRLDTLVREVAESIGYEAEAAGLALALDADWACTVRASRELMCRAVENVLRNAIRHSGGKGPIEVRLGPDAGGRAAQLRIRDHGRGVPEQALPKLFDSYFTVDNPQCTGGLGLGLAIVRHAVRLHGGALTATNAKDGGLAVSITMPLAAQLA